MLGSGEDVEVIVPRQVWSEHQETGEVELSGSDGVEERGKLVDEARGGHAANRGVFREAQLVNAVGVQARTRSSAVEAARFDLAEVREQRRKHLVRTPDQRARIRQ